MLRVLGSVAQVASKPDLFVRLTPRRIRVTGVINDETVPLTTKKNLVGVVVATLFEGSEIGMPGARVALAEQTILAVAAAGKEEDAKVLQSLAADPSDCFVFDAGTYEFV